MGGRKTWTIGSFLFCFIGNGILIAFFLASNRVLGDVGTSVKAAVGGVLTLILWLLVFSLGRRLSRQAPIETGPSPASEGRPSPEAAVQMLAALQREGRLIDFLQEDLSSYEDSQIGAAVRNIHTGCKEALKEHMEIMPVLVEKEGAAVTVPPGFDARAIRLTGNVTGDPPFRGILRHRGWQVDRIRLPQSGEQKNHWILAPAEVEIE
jgi:hypothetical protein